MGGAEKGEPQFLLSRMPGPKEERDEKTELHSEKRAIGGTNEGREESEKALHGKR